MRTRVNRSGWKASRRGYTLLELGVILMAVGILSAFAVVSYTSLDETRDATLVQSVQTSLQAVVSQASARLDVAPDQLPPQNVVNAVKTDVPSVATLDNTYTLMVTASKRGAQYTVSTGGDVRIAKLINFTRFKVNTTDGTIQKI